MSGPASVPGDLHDPWWTRARLAVLGREYLMAGHLIDRASMPHIIGRFGREVMGQIAIDEWMGASPIYTRRMQALLGFAGDDVATIFKGMQFDIGAPHQFLDFRYRVDGPDHGEFWLDHCGALTDVEPMGDEYVTTMCHDIEDPTFDATACATNRRAQVRPIHRPPRIPHDREPHCHWQVDIVADADPLPEPATAEWMAATHAAAQPLAIIAEDAPADGGARDYHRDLDPDLRLEDFSAATLVAVAHELCLQGQILAVSGLAAVAGRADEAVAAEIGRAQVVGVSGVVAARLVRAFDLAPDVDGLATLLGLHPALRPAPYVDVRVELRGEPPATPEAGASPDAGATPEARLAVHLHDSPGHHERDGLAWPALLAGDAGDATLDAIVAALCPTARAMRRSTAAPDALVSWDVRLDAEPAEVPVEVQLTRFSTGADFVLH